MAKQGQIVSKRPQAYLDVSLGSFLAYDIDTILKTIIGPIVVGVVLRIVDKWLNKDK